MGFSAIKEDIPPSESVAVKKLLNEYDIEATKIERIRSVYKITTENKLYCLKRLKHSGANKVVKGYDLSRYLIKNGFYGVVKYNKSKNNDLYISSKHNIFYVTNWIKGREINYDNFDEVKHCMELMGEFHIKATGFTSTNKAISSKLFKWPEYFNNEKESLIKISLLIDNKKVKTNFDISYRNSIDRVIQTIEECISLLNSSNYIELCKLSNQAHTVCHDSFYYQNIIIKNNNKMFLIDLDSSVYDIVVYDIGKLIRRLLYRSSYGWKFEPARELIEEYMKIQPISIKELQVLLIFIIFPHKFCRLGKKKYITKEIWLDTKYKRKLNRILKYWDAQECFVEDYRNYFLAENKKE